MYISTQSNEDNLTYSHNWEKINVTGEGDGGAQVWSEFSDSVEVNHAQLYRS